MHEHRDDLLHHTVGRSPPQRSYLEFEYTDPVRSVDERQRHHRGMRVSETTIVPLMKARPAIVPAIGWGSPMGPFKIDLLQASQGVVGDVQPAGTRRQDLTYLVDQWPSTGRSEASSGIDQSGDGTADVRVARLGRLLDIGLHPRATPRRSYQGGGGNSRWMQQTSTRYCPWCHLLNRGPVESPPFVQR